MRTIKQQRTINQAAQRSGWLSLTGSAQVLAYLDKDIENLIKGPAEGLGK